jgi:hypothetical protein
LNFFFASALTREYRALFFGVGLFDFLAAIVYLPPAKVIAYITK